MRIGECRLLNVDLFDLEQSASLTYVILSQAKDLLRNAAGPDDWEVGNVPRGTVVLVGRRKCPILSRTSFEMACAGSPGRGDLV